MKRTYLLALLAIICGTVFAQTEWKCLGDATVVYPKEINTDETFQYRVTIPQASSFVSSITPDFRSFTVLMGPSTSTSQNISVQNGKMTSTTSVTYTWTLSQKTVGICEIPSYMIKNNETKEYYHVPTARISVNNNSGKGNNKKRQTNVANAKSNQGNDIILRWNVIEQRDIHVGDKVHCQVELLSELSLSAISDLRFIQPDDAYISETDTSSTITPRDTTINDKKYHYCIIKSIDVTPVKAGNSILPKISARLSVYNPIDDPFEAFFNGTTYSDTTVTARAVKLTVKPKALYSTPVDIEHNGIAVCCDVSGSMQSKVNGITRINIAHDFINKIKNDKDLQTSYMAFAKDKEYAWHSDITQYLDTIKNPINDGTALYDAFIYPLPSLKKCKDIIVITDGIDNSSHISARTMLDILREYEVRPHLVYINSMTDSIDFDIYYSPDTLEDGTTTEAHYETHALKNETFTPQEIAEWQSMLRPLGGDIYCIKSKDDINSAIALIMNNICNNSDTASRRSGTTTAAYHYILNKLKADF